MYCTYYVSKYITDYCVEQIIVQEVLFLFSDICTLMLWQYGFASSTVDTKLLILTKKERKCKADVSSAWEHPSPWSP